MQHFWSSWPLKALLHYKPHSSIHTHSYSTSYSIHGYRRWCDSFFNCAVSFIQQLDRCFWILMVHLVTFCNYIRVSNDTETHYTSFFPHLWTSSYLKLPDFRQQLTPTQSGETLTTTSSDLAELILILAASHSDGDSHHETRTKQSWRPEKQH